MTKDEYKQVRECWLVFYDSTSPYRSVLKKGFVHVFLICKDNNRWFTVNYNLSNLTYALLDEDIERKSIEKFKPMLDRCKRSKYTDRVISIKFKYKIFRPKWIDAFRGLFPITFTCVSIAKAYLGITKWYIITPYQLYKYLLKTSMELDKHKYFDSIKLL